MPPVRAPLHRPGETGGRGGGPGRWGAIGLLVAHLAAAPAPARAEEPTPPADARAAATRAFEEGERAFRAGDFAGAAASFEAAYRAAPHAAPLWNAARAWHRAGEIPRAANLYARYLREAPPDAPDRDAAGAALAQIAPRLARIDVVAPDARELRVDDQPLEGASVYVYPGDHVISGAIGDRTVLRTEAIRAGEVRSVALVAEPPPAAPAAPAATPLAPPAAPPPSAAGPGPRAVTPDAPAPGPSRPLPPAAVIIGAAAAAIGAGVTVWSGLDTLAARDAFDAAPTQDNLDAGRAKQLRTNALLGVTIGLGALTGAAAIWLVDWGDRAPPAPAARQRLRPGRPQARAALGAGPAWIGLAGSF
jgi:hypothetical protein